MTGSRKRIILEDCENVTSGHIQDIEQLKGERILVTGGTGFIGTWIAELISYLNDQHGFDTHLTLLSSRASLFPARVPHLANNPDISLIERDIRNLNDIPNDFGWIIHAAASPDSRVHASDPLRTIGVIVNGTDSVLDYAARLPEIRKIVNISSGQVYGAQPWEIAGLPENYIGSLDCSAFNSAYPESKRIAETICAVYRNQQRLPIVNIRPFAFIGPYQRLDRPWAVNNFIRDSLHGGPIRILGDGQTTRSYMYPADMAWWIMNILVRGSVGTNYNIGSPRAITLLELADIIANNFPSPPEINISRNAAFKSSKFVPNVDLAMNSLGLEITVDLETAIKRTIEWNQTAMQ